MNRHTIGDLYQMQSLPLSAKIQMTERRIREWIDHYGADGVFVAFSGGKDNGKNFKMESNLHKSPVNSNAYTSFLSIISKERIKGRSDKKAGALSAFLSGVLLILPN